MAATLLSFSSDRLAIRPWADEVIDRLGFDPRSPYVERFWLGILGPSTTWLLRRVAAGFDTAPDGFELPLADTARALGLGDRGGRHSPFLRSVNRTIQFGMAMATGEGELAVRRRLPPLARRHVERLPDDLQEAHERWQQAQLRTAATPGTSDALRRRSRQLALSLVELGEDEGAAERQLLRWRYHPAVAGEAARWAWEHHQDALGSADIESAAEKIC
jgi:hypothetical protein